MQKKVTLDETDWKILEALQRDGRCSFRDLALQIALSPPATAERVRRLEADGVIAGYQAVLDPVTLGHGLEAIVRISVASGRQCVTLLDELAKLPEVLEAYRVTGTESAVARIAVSSSAHLQRVIDRLTTIGKPTTSICTSARTPPVTTPSRCIAWVTTSRTAPDSWMAGASHALGMRMNAPFPTRMSRRAS